MSAVIFFQFLVMESPGSGLYPDLDPDCIRIWIRIGGHPKMLDLDPDPDP
jgi:hypothetical protein